MKIAKINLKKLIFINYNSQYFTFLKKTIYFIMKYLYFDYLPILILNMNNIKKYNISIIALIY